jgi:hypothetical protein
VAFKELLKVHAVKLVAGQNQLIVVLPAREAMQVLPHGIGSSLKPIEIRHGLFCCENLDEAFGERIKTECRRDVVIERRGIELRQYEQFFQTGIDAVADGNINEPILSAQRDRGFGPVLSQGKKAFSCASGKNYREDVRRILPILSDHWAAPDLNLSMIH